MTRWSLVLLGGVVTFWAACLLPTSGTGTAGNGGAGATTGGFTATAGSGTGAGTMTGGGGTGATGGQGGVGGQGGELLGYGYRRQITISAKEEPVPVGYSVAITIDHQQLVADGKALATGDDVRVLEENAGQWVELDRVVDPASAWDQTTTVLWFRLHQAIGGGSSDSRYYLLHGDPSASSPPADPSQVYLHWDDFEDGTVSPEWTFATIGSSAAGAASEPGGKLHIDANTGDIWDEYDSFVFLHRSVSGGFVADALVTGSAGTLGGWSKIGGVMLRQSTAPGSPNRLMSAVNGAAARTNSWRLVSAGESDEDYEAGNNPLPEYARITRWGSESHAFHSTDGLSWQELGTGITFASEPLTDPLLVGIPLCTMTPTNYGWVELEWYRLVRLVVPAPDVALGTEQVGPF